MPVSSAIANAMLGGLPSPLYVQLHSGDPGPAGVANVITGPGLVRVAVNIPAASGGARTVSTNIDVANVPAGATVSHVSYWNAGAVFQFSQPLGISISFAYGGTLRFTSQVFTVDTAGGGSQTQTSVTTDSTTGAETVTIKSTVNVSDGTTSTESNTSFSGSGASDSMTMTESVTLRLAIVVSDTTAGSEVVNANQTAPSDTTPPVVTDFTVGTPSGLMVTVASFTATDAVGVTGYVITTSATPPAAGAPEWSPTPPLNWSAGSSGTYTLYPWAKDAAGNVSAVFGTPRSVTVSTGAEPGKIVLVSGFTSTPSTVGATSPLDASLFTQRTMPSAVWTAVAWNGSVFCAVSTTGVAATSPDGINWTPQTMPSSLGYRDIIWNGTVFCAITSSTTSTHVATSPDGVNWTSGALPSTGSWSGLAWNGTVFCSVISNSTNGATSPDGLTWTLRSLGSTAYWGQVAWNGSVFATHGATTVGVRISSNGIDWSAGGARPASLPSAIVHNQVAGGSRLLLIPGSGTGAFVSTDNGATWTQQTLPVSLTWGGVFWTGSAFLLIERGTGSGGTRVFTSPTGLTGTWTEQAALPAAVAWCGAAVRP